MPCINWQSPSTIVTGNEIANETVSTIQRRRQQTVTTENRVEWLSSLPPCKALLYLVPSHPQLHHKPCHLGVPSKRPSFIVKSLSPSTPHVDLSDKLGRDSKLNGNERKRRINNNLCLYCGLKDHKVDGCPRKQPVRARLTTLKEQETPLSENPSEN